MQGILLLLVCEVALKDGFGFCQVLFSGFLYFCLGISTQLASEIVVMIFIVQHWQLFTVNLKCVGFNKMLWGTVVYASASIIDKLSYIVNLKLHIWKP